jgi:GTPase SAR1 family protein
MNEEIPELRIALFGASGSGKTTLLASYFGNQQRNGFEEAHGYRLEAVDASDGNRLLQRYYQMENGAFPLGTEKFSEYAFGLKVHDLPTPSLRIVWYDYPGGWWETAPKDDAEKTERKAAIAKLLSSHVGILLVDAQRLMERGSEYIRHTLDQFKNEARKVADELAASGTPIEELPRHWIIAVSKADLLPANTTAESVCKQIVSDAADQLAGVGNAVHAQNFGKQYILLASVKGDGSRVIDAQSYQGLQLIAPVSLVSALNEVAHNADRGIPAGAARFVLEKLGVLVELIDSLDNFLPLKYQALTIILQKLAVKDGIDMSVEFFREKQQKAAHKGKAVEAAAAAMNAELASDGARTTYFRNQL